MSAPNKRPGQPYSPPAQTPVTFPKFPGFTHRRPSPSLTSIPSHDAPVSLPRFPGFTRRSPSSSMTSTPKHDASARQAGREAPRSPTPGERNSRAQPPQKNVRGLAVMLRSPATPHQYETMDELEDELYAADELALSDLRPQSKKKVAAAAKERQGEVTLAHPTAPKTIASVPVPKTATLPQRVSTPQPRPGTSSPGTKSANKGRPKGWKPGMSYADVRNFGPEVAAQNAGMDAAKVHERTRKQRAAAPLPGTQGIRKRRARPPREPEPSPRAIYEKLGIQIVPFLCEWRGCPAELHNLETLERHVHVVHCGKERRKCLWGTCAEGRVRFDTVKELERHVKEAHLVPFAWHVGDGPKVSLPGTQPTDDSERLPDYLFDETGRQVTPSIRDQQVEDYATRKARKKMLKAFLREANEAMPDEVGSEEEDEEASVPALSVV